MTDSSPATEHAAKITFNREGVSAVVEIGVWTCSGNHRCVFEVFVYNTKPGSWNVKTRERVGGISEIICLYVEGGSDCPPRVFCEHIPRDFCDDLRGDMVFLPN